MMIEVNQSIDGRVHNITEIYIENVTKLCSITSMIEVSPRDSV